MQRKSLFDIALCIPAVMAPLALLFPWAAVPGNLGQAFGGPRFFLHWLTKYPTFGPINHEVLLGIHCILATAFLPAALGIYRLTGNPRRWVVMTLAVMAVTAYVPVLVRLDVDLWRVGIFGAWTMLGRAEVYQAAAGPLLRAIAVLAGSVLALRMAIRGARFSAGE
jgi:hypothetical protein